MDTRLIAPQVDRYAVRLAMFQGGQEPLSGSHRFVGHGALLHPVRERVDAMRPRDMRPQSGDSEHHCGKPAADCHAQKPKRARVTRFATDSADD
ncbi:hypothetical protein JCM19992_09250 [Thermostilla marina]